MYVAVRAFSSGSHPTGPTFLSALARFCPAAQFNIHEDEMLNAVTLPAAQNATGPTTYVEDTFPMHGHAFITDGKLTYSPDGDWNGASAGASTSFSRVGSSMWATMHI